MAPGCDGVDARACIGRAIETMGGVDRLAGIRTARYDIIGHRQEPEQSYRQEPFLAEYDREVRIVDYAHGAVDRTREATLPATAPDMNVFKSHVVAVSTGAVVKTTNGDKPAGKRDLEQARDILNDEPIVLLQAAAGARDLHYAPPEWLRATPHTVVAFTDRGRTIRLVLNAASHLPDAIEQTRTFEDFWAVWGDVRQRIYLDGWQDIGGVLFPASRVDQRNGMDFANEQYLAVQFNPVIPAETFRADAAAASRSRASPGWDRAFPSHAELIAPGIWLFEGAWNVSVIEQEDGLILLEAPISAYYTAQALDAAARLVPGKTVKAVISTTDSWPHIAGMREVVARGLPGYRLDLNRPLLERLMAAPHTLRPDDLAHHPHMPHWHEVERTVTIPSHRNPIELIPLRGPSTERQYMVYFPATRLIYASDTLALNPDNSLYDPELMREVAAAVKREKIAPQTVYAMHQGPIPWSRVIGMLPR